MRTALELFTLNTSSWGDIVQRSLIWKARLIPRSSCTSRSRNLVPGATSGIGSDALVSFTPAGMISAPGVQPGTVQAKGYRVLLVMFRVTDFAGSDSTC